MKSTIVLAFIAILFGCSKSSMSEDVTSRKSMTSSASAAVSSFDLLASVSVERGSARFGASVQISGDTIYVGDPGAGAVHIVSRTGGDAWHLAGMIKAPDGRQGFGHDLAVDRNELIIGAYSRITHEDGAVYGYNRQTGVHKLADSDNTHVVGFSVAAHAGRSAYSRRLRNDPAHQSGDVVLMDGRHQIIYSSKEYPDYFGADISLNGNRLFVMAPAYGKTGGALMFDVRDKSRSGVPFAVPGSLPRANVGNPVLIANGGCVISALGSETRKKSVFWKDCKPGNAVVIDAVGHVSASSAGMVFSDIPAVPRMGAAGPFSVSVFLADDGLGRIRKLSSEKIRTSLTRNVAMSDRYLVVPLTDAAGKASIEIYRLGK